MELQQRNLSGTEGKTHVPTLNIKIKKSRVYKVHLRELLGINKYAWSVNIRDLAEDNPEFAKLYTRYKYRHYISLKLTKYIIKYSLGSDIKISFSNEVV